jgi:hypothetical protein
MEVYFFHFRSTTTAQLLTRLKHPSSKVQVNIRLFDDFKCEMTGCKYNKQHGVLFVINDGCCFVVGYKIDFPLPTLKAESGVNTRLPTGLCIEANFQRRGTFFRGRIAYFNEVDESYDILVCISHSYYGSMR